MRRMQKFTLRKRLPLPAILNAHELDSLKTREEARRLLYIAMIRARDELCISSARPSWIVGEVARVLQFSGAS
jgi:superfamily I DNA/RNA helicase